MSVIVVGAGVIGTAVAEELASRDVDVTVIDMRSPGRGASQASAGMLAPYVEAQEHPALLTLCIKSLNLYDAFVSRIAERSGRSILYGRSGTIEIATNDESLRRLSEMREWLETVDVSAEWLYGPDLHSLEPSLSDRAMGGLLISIHGIVGVQSLVQALVHAARLQGARFESPVEAVNIVERRDGVDVLAGDRRLTAERVVIAAGSWSGRVRISGVPPLAVRPIRGQLVQLGWSGRSLPTHSLWGCGVYTVPWHPDTLLVGATVEDVGFDERSSAAGVQQLLSGVSALLPEAATSAIIDIRVGLRPASADGLPVIGPITDGSRICAATGHYRNGVLLAPVTALLVADLIASNVRDPLLSHTSPTRALH